MATFPTENPRTGRNPGGPSASQAIRTRGFWLLLPVLGLQFVGLSGLSVHLIPLLEDVGYSSTQAASILGLVFLLSGIGRFGSGIVSDWIDRRLGLAGVPPPVFSPPFFPPPAPLTRTPPRHFPAPAPQSLSPATTLSEPFVHRDTPLLASPARLGPALHPSLPDA